MARFDPNAFIFTLKNPYAVEPTRFMKRKESRSAIYCDPNYGPVFFDGKSSGSDLYIGDKCNDINCGTMNDGNRGFECHPKYKMALFVKTATPNIINFFGVMDYEVYCIDYDDKYTIDHLCKYPDIIWNYMKTKDISEESLSQVDDDTELLKDFDSIICNDSNIRLKISKYCLKSPSIYLPNTQIVCKKYDFYLKKWLGKNKKWRLIYRASEHGYTAKSFHEYCDNAKPSLIVIKSSEGWIFGGYTTQSWKYVDELYGCIYNNMI